MSSRIVSAQQKNVSKTVAIRNICNFFADSASKILDIKTSTAIVTFMKTLCDHSDDECGDIKPLISEFY